VSRNDDHVRDSKLELDLAGALLAHADQVSVGENLTIAPSDDFWAWLEWFVPQLLRKHYSEWERESIDGWFASVGTKTGSRSARFAGTCILITDQTVTPFLLELSVSRERDSIDSVEVSLGETGGGHLGISGPKCNTKEADALLANLRSRLGRIQWRYAASRGIDSAALDPVS